MKKYIGMAMLATIVALTSCTGTHMITAGNEVDDVYYNKDDRRADQAAADKARAQAEAARVDQPTQVAQEDPQNTSDGSYDQGLAAKNGETESLAPGSGYADDDYYYSRQVRRFNTSSNLNNNIYSNRSWNYYDPYYSYDPYYAIGTPTWNYYSNSPWWYDPYYYNGPSYAWTSNWGAPAYSYYPSQYFYNQPWNYYSGYGYGNGYGFGGYNNYGGGFGGYNYYGGGFGGYGGYGYANGYCGAPGYYGGGTYFGNGVNTSNSNTVIAHRNNTSSLNTSGRPGNQPVLQAGQTRPYQGQPTANNTPTTRPIKDYNIQSANPNVDPGRAAYTRPVYNTGNAGSKPDVRSTESGSRPTFNNADAPRSIDNGNSRPTFNNGNTRPTESYSRPTMDNGNTRPTINNGGSRPVENNSRPSINNGNSRPVENYSRPRNDSYSQPSRSYESAPSPRPSYSAPSNSSPSMSRPSTGSSAPRQR